MSLSVALEKFLKEDSVELIGHGAERMVKCVSPTHDDNKPSMSVNVSTGVFICHGCGFSGNAYTYLRDVRKWTHSEIEKLLVGDYGWKAAKVKHASHSVHHFDQKKQIEPPKHSELIPASLAQRKIIMLHKYENIDGVTTFYMARYRTIKNTKGPKCLPFTPCSTGGYWCCGPMHPGLPAVDKKADKYQLYNLREVAHMTSDPEKLPTIWIVEGEKCVDVIKEMVGVPDGHKPPVTSVYGSKKDLARTDLRVLEGKPVLLIADQDLVGRSSMKELGGYLNGLGCAVNYILPTGEDTGYDIADVIGEGGWVGVQEWFKKVGITKHRGVKLIDNKEKQLEVMPPMADTDAFKVLGIHHAYVVIQSKVTHQVHYFKNTTMSSPGTLQVIASAAFWQDILHGEGFSYSKREAIGDSLLRAAEYRGFFDGLNESVGRGASRSEDGKILFNVGNGILTEDENGMMTVFNKFGETDYGIVIHPGKAIEYADDDKGERYLEQMYHAIMRYRWSSENHGRAYVGWLLTSLIGGALKFRPMLWLLSQPGLGKSFLIDDIGKVFHKGYCFAKKNTTTAALVGALQSDSLPAMIDEFQADQNKEDKWRDMLSLIRVATNGDGGYARGTASGGSVSTNIRFSMILASAYRPDLSDADNQRIMPVKLSEHGVDDWLDVRDKIKTCLTPARVLAMRGWIIKHTSHLVRKIDALESQFINEGFTTRQSEISAALTVGAGFMSGDYEMVHRREEVITHDYMVMLKFVFGSALNRFQDTFTISEMLHNAYFNEMDWFVEQTPPGSAMYMARRHIRAAGFKFIDGGMTLLVAPGVPMLKEVVSRDNLSSGSFREYLISLPGAETKRDGKYLRFSSGGVTAMAIAVCYEVLEEIGFYSSVPKIAPPYILPAADRSGKT